MCLSVPAKIIRIEKDKAIADFGNTEREVSVMLVPHVKVGDYVLVHAGFAIQVLDQKEALKTLDAFKELYGQEKGK